jgi:hypothetical protein
MKNGKGVVMFKEGRKIVLISAVVAAIGFGASAMAIAGAATKTPSTTAKTVPNKHHGHQAGSPATEPPSGADTDNVESGPQTGPDNGDQAGDPEAGDSTEQPGSETSDGQEPEGSEVPGNDGPGGHADEPGNPNANHEAGGQTEE